MHIRFTDHALLEMRERRITRMQVRRVLEKPGQVIPSESREVRQSRIVWLTRHYLLRVVVEISVAECAVITAYRTSKIAKYWRGRP